MGYCSHASGVLQGTGDARKVGMECRGQSSNVLQGPGDACEVVSVYCGHASGVLQGTGDAGEVALEDRRVLALEGLVVVALVVKRPKDGQPLAAQSIRITTRAMWTKRGELIQQMQKVGPGTGTPMFPLSMLGLRSVRASSLMSGGIPALWEGLGQGLGELSPE